MDVATAQKLGAPTGKDFETCFGQTCETIFAIHFEQVQADEVPKNLSLMKKSVEALERLRGMASAKKPPMKTEEILEGEELDRLFQPPESRAVRDKKEEQELRQRAIQFPQNLLKRFIEHAWPHSPKEFMAWITGTIDICKKSKQEICRAQGLFFPKQDSTNTECFEAEGDFPKALLNHLEETGCSVVGWVHSHPTFDAFFSSVDQHMMAMIQRDLPLAFGLVVDQNKEARCLRLSAAGMAEVQKCSQNPQASC